MFDRKAITKMQSIILAVIVIVAVVAAAGYYYFFLMQPEKVTLNVLTLGGPRFEVPSRALAEEFVKEYPNIEIEFTTGGGEVLYEKGPMELASGKGTFDLVMLDYPVCASMSAAGYLLPLDDFITDPEIGIPDFYDAFAHVTHWRSIIDGKWYAMPCDLNTGTAFYRTDMFEKLGLTEDDVDSYLEMEERWWKDVQGMEYYDEESGETQTLYAWSVQLKAGIWSWQQFLWTAYGWGVELWDPPGPKSPEGVWLNTNLVRWTLGNMSYWYHNYMPPDAINWYDPQNAEAIEKGWVPYVVSSITPASFSPETNPYHWDDIESVVCPKGPGTNKTYWSTGGPAGRCSMTAGLNYGIDVASKHPREAYLYLKYMQEPGNMRLWIENTGWPCRLSALADPEMWAITPESYYLKALNDNAPYGFMRPLVPETLEIEHICGITINAYLAGEITLDECVDTMQRETTAIFERSGRFGAGGQLSGEQTIAYLSSLTPEVWQFNAMLSLYENGIVQ